MEETLGELAAALRTGAATSVELVERSLERIGRIDPQLNSFVMIDRAGALVAARESDAYLARGWPRSPLEGIPLSIKDNIHVANMPSSWGSRALADFMPPGDELPIARLRAAGAVFLGKTNVPEFTLEGYTSNELYGVTRNPWDIRLTPGGSSGGGAAGVAAGLVPAAIGTDGGGSIRRPACHTGLVGWKPSIGRWPRFDGFPAILTDFETLGTLTRNVDDAILLDEILRGRDARDRRSFYGPAPPWPERPLRILHIPRFGAAPVDPEVHAGVTEFALRLALEGHDVQMREVFFDLEDVARIWRVVSRSGVAWLMRENAAWEPKAGLAARAMAADGRSITGADYIDALERTAALRRVCAELFSGVDLVLTPTAAALPWPAQTPYPDRIGGQAAAPRDHAIFTGWVNISGLPAISLPIGLSASRLPIGVQLVAAFGADGALLEVARKLSNAFPPPPLPIFEGRP